MISPLSLQPRGVRTGEEYVTYVAAAHRTPISPDIGECVNQDNDNLPPVKACLQKVKKPVQSSPVRPRFVTLLMSQLESLGSRPEPKIRYLNTLRKADPYLVTIQKTFTIVSANVVLNSFFAYVLQENLSNIG